MKGQIKNTLKGLMVDFLFWLYLFGCLYYLLHNNWGWTVRNKFILITAMFFTGLFFLIGDSLGRKSFLPTASTNRKWSHSVWGWLLVIVLIVTFLVGWNIVEVNPYKFFTKFRNAGGITSGIFDPSIVGYQLSNQSLEELKLDGVDQEILEKLSGIIGKRYNTRKVCRDDLKRILDEEEFRIYGEILLSKTEKNMTMLNQALTALAETIFLALLATIFAIPFAFILSFFAARNLMPHTFLGNSVYIIIRTIATIFRSIEAIVWAIIFSVWVGIGPFAGMLALMIHSIAALTKLYSEQIENIDHGPVEAIKATGASTIQTWIFAVIPQIISPYLAFTIYRWDINVRMATIVGFVGGGGIGLLLMQQQQLLRWHNVGLIIWLIAAVVWTMDMISAKVRTKLTSM
ncbi:MAG: phosphonate ABC transporter, permease protein PhnE [Candidatus Cloacimonetes bacterium]|nr:phosphonate ABC transporter, permease protein PhnE [Candidatus Cloacimonadota bacterium]